MPTSSLAGSGLVLVPFLLEQPLPLWASGLEAPPPAVPCPGDLPSFHLVGFHLTGSPPPSHTALPFFGSIRACSSNELLVIITPPFLEHSQAHLTWMPHPRAVLVNTSY